LKTHISRHFSRRAATVDPDSLTDEQLVTIAAQSLD